MQNITQNLFFNTIALLSLGSGIWYLFTDQAKKVKLDILNIFTDLLLYFIFTALGVNILLNFSRILETPYQILILSSKIISISTFLIMIYAGYVYGKKLWNYPDIGRSTTQLFLFLFLTNHLYVYFIYSSLQSILFIGFFIILLAITSSTYLLNKIDSIVLFLVASFIHHLLMGNRAILYFNYAFYPIQLTIIIITLIVILYIQRRQLQSKPK